MCAQGWNLRRLDTILSSVLNDSGHKLLGVNTPYLYFGQWRSVFAWWVEIRARRQPITRQACRTAFLTTARAPVTPSSFGRSDRDVAMRRAGPAGLL